MKKKPVKKSELRNVTDTQTKRGIKDARNRIILRKRTQIIDARDKLIELAKKKDARVKLEQLRMKKIGKLKPFKRQLSKNRTGKLSFKTNEINKGILCKMI